MEFVRNAWYAILDVSDVPRAGRMLRLKRFSTDMIVWRHADGVTVQDDRCPHKGAPLSLGKVVDGRVRCAYHAMEFDAQGKCKYVPQFADQSKIPKGFCAKTYPTRVEHGIVWLWWGNAQPSAEIPFFSEIAGETRLSKSLAVDLPVGFVRMMESQVDLYHVDHLHGWPLRFFGRIIKDSTVETCGRYIRCENTYLDPQTGEQQATRSTILFPGLSLQESQADFKFKNLLAVTPIDENTTWFFMRLYFAPLRIPVIGDILTALINLNSYLRVVPEDAMVQSRQLPRTSGMGSDQLIVPADRGVLEYWRLLRSALETNDRERSKTRALHVIEDAVGHEQAF